MIFWLHATFLHYPHNPSALLISKNLPNWTKYSVIEPLCLSHMENSNDLFPSGWRNLNRWQQHISQTSSVVILNRRLVESHHLPWQDCVSIIRMEFPAVSEPAEWQTSLTSSYSDLWFPPALRKPLWSSCQRKTKATFLNEYHLPTLPLLPWNAPRGWS